MAAAVWVVLFASVFIFVPPLHPHAVLAHAMMTLSTNAVTEAFVRKALNVARAAAAAGLVLLAAGAEIAVILIYAKNV